MVIKKTEFLLRLFYKYGLNFSTFKFAQNLFFGRKYKIFKIKLKPYLYPIFLRKDGSELDVFFEVILTTGYNFRTELDFIPETIVDCGANIGLASIYFKSKFPESKIIAIEPEERNFELMKQNLDSYRDIICENVGIWSKDTYVGLDRQDATSWGFSFHEVEKETSGSVKASSITSIMQKHAIDMIDILKIDIEGAEKEIFTSGYKYWMDRTRLLIIELHDRRIEGCSKAFFDALSQYNFSIEIRGENLFCFIKH